MIEIYTTKTCPACSIVKKSFKGKKIDFEEIVLETQQQINEFTKRTGKVSVPQIYEDNRNITERFKY